MKHFLENEIIFHVLLAHSNGWTAQHWFRPCSIALWVANLSLHPWKACLRIYISSLLGKHWPRGKASMIRSHCVMWLELCTRKSLDCTWYYFVMGCIEKHKNGEKCYSSMCATVQADQETSRTARKMRKASHKSNGRCSSLTGAQRTGFSMRRIVYPWLLLSYIVLRCSLSGFQWPNIPIGN